MHRYDPEKRLANLRRSLVEERRILENLKVHLRDFVPHAERYRTHYEHAHFQGISKADIGMTISRTEGRIRYYEHEIEVATRDPEGLLY